MSGIFLRGRLMVMVEFNQGRVGVLFQALGNRCGRDRQVLVGQRQNPDDLLGFLEWWSTKYPKSGSRPLPVPPQRVPTTKMRTSPPALNLS